MNNFKIKKILNLLKDDPLMLLIGVYSSFFSLYYKSKKGIFIGENNILKGVPTLETTGSGQIHTGKNVTLYSTRRKYFAHMGSPVRLFAEEGKIIIGDNSRINGATIHSKKKISIGANCLIAANTSIIDSNGHQTSMENPNLRINTIDEPKPIVIEDAVWIGLNCIILKGVKIGYGSIIGASSVVNRDIPALSLVVGNPARVIRKYGQ